jgi:hypothetical protein
MSKLLKAKWARAAFVLVAFAGMIAFFVWHGPKWGLVVDAFRFVAWESQKMPSATVNACSMGSSNDGRYSSVGLMVITSLRPI